MGATKYTDEREGEREEEGRRGKGRGRRERGEFYKKRKDGGEGLGRLVATSTL